MGKTRSLKVQLVPDDSGYRINMIRDGKKTYNFKLKNECKRAEKGIIDLFDIKFQLPKNKKSPFPYQLPSVDINLGTLEEAKV